MPQALRRGKRRAPALRLGRAQAPLRASRRSAPSGAGLPSSRRCPRGPLRKRASPTLPQAHPAGPPRRSRRTCISSAPSRAPTYAHLAHPFASAPRPPIKGLPIPKDRRLYIALQKIGQIMRIWTPFWQICPIWTPFRGHFRDFCVHIAFIWPVFLRTESPPSAPPPLHYRAPSPPERLRVSPLPSTLSTHPRALLRRFATKRLRPLLGAFSPTHFQAPPELNTPSASLLR